MEFKNTPTGKIRFSLSDKIETEAVKRRGNPLMLFCDLGAFFVGLLFAGCHLAFGAYPIAIAFLSALPERVFLSAAGCVVGSLIRGNEGIVYAVAAVITVCIRVIISSGNRSPERKLFRESLLLRSCAAVIGGFVAGAYTLLLNGLTLATVTYSLAMVLLPGILCFLFSGLFTPEIPLQRLLFGKHLFEKSAVPGNSMPGILFQGSFLVFEFLTAFSLDKYAFFGISPAYLWVGILTLWTAKRFGVFRSMAVGFLGGLAVSTEGAVAFALAGMAAGVLFDFGDVYALIGGGAALIGWSSLNGGLNGFLGTFPEYAVSALLSVPICRKTERSGGAVSAVSDTEKAATDMVGTMALSFRNRAEQGPDQLENALATLSPLIRKLGEEDRRPNREDYRAVCVSCSETYCKACAGYDLCTAQNHRPFSENADQIADRLMRGEKVSCGDLGPSIGFCSQEKKILESICRDAARLRCAEEPPKATEAIGMTCEWFSKTVNEARLNRQKETDMNDEKTAALEKVFRDGGFPEGVVRVFGREHPSVIAAGEDGDGSRITSPDLRRALETALGAKLGAPEYFRKDAMVLMKCNSAKKFRVESATAALPGSRSEISGDTVTASEGDKLFSAVISDGMGSGETAKRTSAFVSEFLERTLHAGCSAETALRLLNAILRSRKEECSATVDLFTMDLVNGEAGFVKSGAASSYLKRGNSVYRIRSATAPIGLLDGVDSEKIRVEVGVGDVILLVSDGVSQSAEDAPWLPTLLADSHPESLGDFANRILTLARKNNAKSDDMSVVILRIASAE